MGQIFLVRHGQASFGAGDYDRLSERGVRQSQLLGQWFGDCGQALSGAAMGGMLRHRQTAEACLAAMPESLRPAGETTIDLDFNEYDHHEVLIRLRPDFADPAQMRAVLAQGDNPRKLFQRIFMEAMARWISGRHDAEYRESWGAFRTRCRQALARLIERAGGSQNLVVFTSGGPIAVICQDLLGVDDRNAALLNTGLVNAAVTRLLYQPGRVSISYLNAFPHLERTRDPADITYR
jgi:broad specificity phosphatase PhoE